MAARRARVAAQRAAERQAQMSMSDAELAELLEELTAAAAAPHPTATTEDWIALLAAMPAL
jgi:hypothetical protein